MARVLGLDLGSHAVKGLLLETGARSGPVVRAAVQVRRAAEGEKLDTLKAAVRELLAHPELRAEVVAIALPFPSLATHQASLPFTDPKRIEATIGFEVESQLPFELSEAAFDYQVAQQQEKKSDLLIGVTRKDELRTLLAALAEVGVDPRVVTHPSLAYQTMLTAIPGSPEGDAVAIVDVGHERTTVAIGRAGGAVEFARTFPGGGRDLTRTLAAEFQTAPLDAETWKDENAAIGSAAAGPEGERASGAFLRGLQPVVRELRSTFRAFAAKSRRPVSQIYLCGGTARMRGLDAQLSSDLGIPTVMLPLPPDQTPELAQAYALALRAGASGAKAPRFNLRRGEFSFKGDFDYLRDRIGLIASYAATLLVLLVASMLVRSSMLTRRERAVDAELCDVTKRVIGTCERNYDRALSMMRGQESPAEVIPKLSAVNILGQLTQRVPAELPVTFDQMTFDLERVSLRGETDTTRHVDELTAALKTWRCFRDIRQGRLEKTRDGAKVSFRLDIQVECPGEAGAPQG